MGNWLTMKSSVSVPPGDFYYPKTYKVQKGKISNEFKELKPGRLPA